MPSEIKSLFDTHMLKKQKEKLELHALVLYIQIGSKR